MEALLYNIRYNAHLVQYFAALSAILYKSRFFNVIKKSKKIKKIKKNIDAERFLMYIVVSSGIFGVI